jgi:putative phosphoesterase
MRIAILSDAHDNIWKLDVVLKQLEDVDALLFCGDLCAPFTLAAIAEGFDGPVHVVFGNNDGDQWLLTRNANRAGNVSLHGMFASLELGGRRIAMTHYPAIAVGMAASGLYDLVCYGHDHERKIERVGECLKVNPGEVMGRFGVSSYALYDTETGQAEIRES